MPFLIGTIVQTLTTNVFVNWWHQDSLLTEIWEVSHTRQIFGLYRLLLSVAKTGILFNDINSATYLKKELARCGSRGGTRGPGPPLTLGFKAPKLSIFGPYLIFPYFFLPRFTQHIISLICCFSHSSNSKIFQPHASHSIWISHLKVSCV